MKNFICEDLNHPEVDAEQSFEKVIKQKSHSHCNIYFTSASCQNNDMQLSVHSKNQCLNSNVLYDFFKNDDYRKLYNQVISKCKSYHLWQAKNWFLNELIHQKIVPKYFKVQNKSNNTQSDAALITSLEWMQNALDNNKTIEKNILQELTDRYNTLIEIVPDHLKAA